MKKLIIAAVACLATFAVEAAPAAGKPPAARPARGAPRTQKATPVKTTTRKTIVKRGGAMRHGDRRSRMSKHDQHLLDRIEEADSMRELRRYMQEAAASREEDVRAAMVDALERVDDHSPSDFVYFIADPSEDVAESAFSAWTSALEDARGHRRVRAIIEAAQILQGGKWQGQTPPPMPAPGMVPVAPAVVQPVQTVVQPSTVPVTQPATVPVTQPVVY